MKRPIVIVILSLILASGTVWYLGSQNKVLQHQNEEYSYRAFNCSDDYGARRIMQAWRGDEVLKGAVRHIVFADYFLILVYTSFLLWLISQRLHIVRYTPHQQRALYLLHIARWLFLTLAILDFVQDSYILYQLSDPKANVESLIFLTSSKWRAAMAGAIFLIVALLPAKWLPDTLLDGIMDHLSSLLKTVWIFFPTILFIYLSIYCFWIRSQGQDILVAFTEPGHPELRVVFFFVVGFWTYVTWYTTRIVSYIKKDNVARSARPNRFIKDYLVGFPRVAGNACLVVVELAILQIPIFGEAIGIGAAWIIGGVALILLMILDRFIKKIFAAPARAIGNKMGYLVAIYILIVFIISWQIHSQQGYIFCMLGLVLLLHIMYLFYGALHRVTVNQAHNHHGTDFMDDYQLKPPPANAPLSEKIMAFFSLPEGEKGFVHWFFWLSVIAVITYITAVIKLDFARGVGPFSIVILAFTLLMGFGNLITALSVRQHINFHFVLILLALFVGIGESHRVRVDRLEDHASNNYSRRPNLQKYLETWLRRLPDDDSPYDAYFVLSNGGASRSGYWTASILGRLEDSSRLSCAKDTFSRHLFCLSGTSGGGVGVAAFYGLLADQRVLPQPCFQASADTFLSQDYFTYTLARMLGPDYFNYIFRIANNKDRGAALEESFERYSATTNHYDPGFTSCSRNSS